MELSVQQSTRSFYLLYVKCNDEIIEEMLFSPSISCSWNDSTAVLRKRVMNRLRQIKL